MAFRELTEFFDDTLPLTICGKVYRIPGPNAETGLYCQRLLQTGAELARRQAAGESVEGLDTTGLNLGDNDEHDLFRRIMGPAMDEMIADGLSWPLIQVAGNTTAIWIGAGAEMAEQYWENGGRNPTPLSMAANRSERRSIDTAGANGTKLPDSTNGTKSRPRTRRASKAT